MLYNIKIYIINNILNNIINDIINNIIYIGIYLSIWFNANYFSNLIINHNYYIFYISEYIYWIFASVCLMFNELNINKWRIAKNITGQIGEKDIFSIVVRNHILLGLFFFIYNYFYPPVMENISTNIFIFSLKIIIFIILYDIIYYILHRIIHYNLFYKYIHKMHHQTYANIGMSGYYMGCIDLFCEFIIPFFLPLYFTGNDPLIALTLGIIGQLYNINTHCGYNFPLMSCDNSHLIHHTNIKYNYGALFMDYIFNTNYL